MFTRADYEELNLAEEKEKLVFLVYPYSVRCDVVLNFPPLWKYMKHALTYRQLTEYLITKLFTFNLHQV